MAFVTAIVTTETRQCRWASAQFETRAASIRFQAERKAGEFLGEMGMGHHGGDRRSSSSLELETVGLTKKESHRFQLLAKVPEAELVEPIAGLP